MNRLVTGPCPVALAPLGLQAGIIGGPAGTPSGSAGPEGFQAIFRGTSHMKRSQLAFSAFDTMEHACPQRWRPF